MNTIPLRLRNGASGASTDTITVGASLDITSSKAFARALTRLARRQLTHVIVDMSKTRTVDSSGFGSLMAGLKKLGESGATPLVVCSDPTVRRFMDFSGIARTIAIYDRVSEARRAIAQIPADELAS